MFRIVPWLACVIVTFLFIGCSSIPASSDSGKGKEILQMSLDAWKRGDSVATLEAGNPSITFVDFQRQKDFKLLEFEIDPESKPSGFDVQFVVQLSLQSADGKKTKQKAKYNVSTTPKFVVVRSDDA